MGRRRRAAEDGDPRADGGGPCEPWFTPVFEPPSGEIESLFISLRAAMGVLVIGNVFGSWRTSRRMGQAGETAQARARWALSPAPTTPGDPTRRSPGRFRGSGPPHPGAHGDGIGDISYKFDFLSQQFEKFLLIVILHSSVPGRVEPAKAERCSGKGTMTAAVPTQ